MVMKLQSVLRKIGTGTLAATLIMAVSAHVTAQAQKQETRKTPAMSEAIYKELGKAAELAAPPEELNKEPDFARAMEVLRKTERDCKDKCNKYELASIYRYMGWVAYSLEDTKAAIRYYQQVIAQSPEIPLGIELESLKTLAQMTFSEERYDDALSYLNKWISLADEIGSDIYHLKAMICYSKEDMRCALENIDIAVKMVESRGNVAQENWYNLQRALYQNKEDYRTALNIMEKLVRHYPKKSYWVQMGSLYGVLERERDQLQAMDVTYLMNGFDREQQLINLAYLYLGAEVPYKAAQIIRKGMSDKIIVKNEKNLELLGRALYMAQEVDDAIPVMEDAASKADKGDLFGQLVAMYIDRDQNQKAIAAGHNAIKKGGLDRPGDVHLNMGRAYLELKKYDEAISSFAKSAKIKETEKLALSWKTHAEREKSRAEQLAKAAEAIEAGGT